MHYRQTEQAAAAAAADPEAATIDKPGKTVAKDRKRPPLSTIVGNPCLKGEHLQSL